VGGVGPLEGELAEETKTKKTKIRMGTGTLYLVDALESPRPARVLQIGVSHTGWRVMDWGILVSSNSTVTERLLAGGGLRLFHVSSP
jgi:hypothetical protein